MTKQEITKDKKYFNKLQSYSKKIGYVVRHTLFQIIMIITEDSVIAENRDGTAFTFDMGKDSYERFLGIVKDITIQKVTAKDITLSVES